MADASVLRSTASLVGITSSLVLAGFNISTSHLFVPLLYPLDKQTSARMFDRLYHDGMKVVVPLAAAAITSYSYLAYASSSSSPSSSSRLGAGTVGGSSSSSSSSSSSVLLGTSLARSPAFAAAAGLVVATLAWTVVVVMPVNKKLISVAREVGAKDKVSTGDVVALLRQWWWMNYVRGAGALVAGILGLAASL
ncbi:hypothetical protein diail_2081 [Diaporthe ilicicola]|nr:hypothetical protein diail_2081 [Diaporthe ilicicola]